MKLPALALLVSSWAIFPVPTVKADPTPAEKTSAQAAKAPLYDESADASKQIATAVASAKAEHRRVLIQWGGNWCPWCIRMGELMSSDKPIAHMLQYEYELIHVDCGRKMKNVDLAEGYGATVKKDGFPYLTILDGDGKTVVNQASDPLEAVRAGTQPDDQRLKVGHDAAALLKFLEDHKAPAFAAQPLLDGALAEAKRTGRLVFLHFGAPWCGWCRRLEKWMAEPATAAILSKGFVDLKIDTDRATGGSDLLKKYAHGSPEGIPWYAFLDAQGNLLADSTGPKGNIGFPGEPQELEHFGKMLRAAGGKLTQSDIDALLASLATKKAAAAPAQ